MSVILADLIATIAVNMLAVAALGLRLRWKALQRREHRMQMVELARALPTASCAESQEGPTGLRTSLTVGGATERDR
jgi:hypothetical protein